MRVFLSPGVPMPDYPLGTSLTVVAVSHGGVLYAGSIRQSLLTVCSSDTRWRLIVVTA